ncbi:iron-containing alcohol dehydrogenase [Butyricicoccus porcorum]|uniref:NADH-dependent alcohol dehydrogenase n=1 Tax=Butyricicoccus porcorum TaxID=1945634 RepID=A0A252F1R2_9FIRM|nr:iron-containing alcohol dehydrogenase [Butyricicoccus porcorum]MCI6927139.1 iron-containing alcohol dehydrogenase [Butyricicoccus porcorum]MDD6987280.1 iron-containing alcohol dehydrogenase [Butyricicoccus porcorum]OUM19679.1 NADH-dependent alcohol dehydrogenase [Butyricicoccus porcorum]
MNSFRFCVPTDIRFGEGQISCLPEELGKYGKNVLLVYGGGSIKRSGLYDTIQELLKDFNLFELSGIEPNPKITSVRKGVALCREHSIDVILAVGGGSCIDASKNIACGAYYDGDPWDLVIDRSKMTKALPIAVVLTICATGSEMNCGAVISNEETHEKLEIAGDILYPALSVCDPTYLYTLPARQTAAGTADIMSHVFEQYFQPYDGAYLTDRFCESVLKTCIHYAPIALAEPDNYEARSNLMWSSTIGLNHLLTVGKGGAWSCHAMEHELSAYYDITHGVGLAIVTPAWMRYVLCDRTEARFAMYARNVWGITEPDDRAAAEQGIARTEEFFQSLGLPSTLREVGIGPEKFEEMAAEAVRTSGIATRSYYHLQPEDVVKIYESCLG